MSSNKKLLITIGSFLLIIVLLIVGLKLVGSRSNTKEPEIETTTSSGGYVEEVTDIEETSEVQAAATIPEMNNDVSTAISDAIYAYMSGQYYLDGSMTSDGTVTDINIAISGNDFYTSTEMEGMTVSILYKNSKIYFINNDDNSYIELSDVLMDSYDIDFSEVENLTEYLNLTQYNFTGFDRYSDTLDGQTADCFKYYNDEMCVIFCFVGEELKQVDMGDGSGKINSSIFIKEFSPQVPAGMMSLSGLRKTTIFAFFGESLL